MMRCGRGTRADVAVGSAPTILNSLAGVPTANAATLVFNGVTPGNLLLVAGFAYQATITIADSGSNTWTSQVSITTGDWRGNLFTSPVTTGGNLTITVSCTGGNEVVPAGYVLSGQAGSFLDGTASNPNAASSTTKTVNLPDTTFARDLVIGFFYHYYAGNTNAFTPSGGWTAGPYYDVDSGNFSKLQSAHQATSSAGAYDPNGTTAFADVYSALAIAIKGT